MKIGIITFHKAENFGSALQAYALSSYLEKTGNEVRIIDFIYPHDMRQYHLFRTHIYRERPKALLGDLCYLRKNLAKKNAFKSFWKTYLKLTPRQYVFGTDTINETNEMFDTFICGSDQIWNINCTQIPIPEYFLDFASDRRRKIAYAPSMPCGFDKKYHIQVADLISRLDWISVREALTVEYLKDELQIVKPVYNTADPTMLLPAEDYIKAFCSKKENEKYIFVYMLGDSEIMKDIINCTLSIKEKTGLKIKYVFIRRIKNFPDAEYCFGIGPDKFLDDIYNADYVVTDSFHATVFSLMFKKALFVFGRKDSELRMKELLKETGMLSRYIENGNIPTLECEYDESFNEKWNSMVDDSKIFLQQALM